MWFSMNTKMQRFNAPLSLLAFSKTEGVLGRGCAYFFALGHRIQQLQCTKAPNKAGYTPAFWSRDYDYLIWLMMRNDPPYVRECKLFIDYLARCIRKGNCREITLHFVCSQLSMLPWTSEYPLFWPKRRPKSSNQNRKLGWKSLLLRSPGLLVHCRKSLHFPPGANLQSRREKREWAGHWQKRKIPFFTWIQFAFSSVLYSIMSTLWGANPVIIWGKYSSPHRSWPPWNFAMIVFNCMGSMGASPNDCFS